MQNNNNLPDLSKILKPGDRLTVVTVEEVRVRQTDPHGSYPISCMNDEGEFFFFSKNGVSVHSESMSLYPNPIELPEADWSEYEGRVWNGERYEKGELVAVRDMDLHTWFVAKLDYVTDTRVFVQTTDKRKTATSFLQMCKIDSLK